MHLIHNLFTVVAADECSKTFNTINWQSLNFQVGLAFTSETEF